MKTFAKEFYEGKSWRDCRESFLISKNYTCERCFNPANIAHHKTYLTPINIHNPYISLSQNNLEALCQDCHNKEHHATETELPYTFDKDGNVVYPPIKIPGV